MNGNNIKLKFIDEDKYGFIKGNIYRGFPIKSKFPSKEKMICIIDDYGEEYAYPLSWFEIVDE